jgi:hypothetical protein
VGSLFHEAMKFREDFYQREVYGPRVRLLRAEAGAEADGLFVEFERILSAVSVRLQSGVAETQSLMAQSWGQLRVMLAERSGDGFITRFLIENRETLDQLSPGGLEGLLEDIHGDGSTGYAVAGGSYLVSGHYEAAEQALSDALERGGDPREIAQLSAYARGMSAFLAGDYPEGLARLSQWVEGGSPGGRPLRDLVCTALKSLGRLVEGQGRDEMLEAAAKIRESLESAS